MAHGNFVLDKGYRVAAGQTVTKYRAVKFSAAETVTPVTAITDQVAGVAQYSVSAAELLKGKGCSTRVMGVSEMEASAAIPVGSAVSAGTDGRAKVAATGERVIGVCVGHAAANAGDRIACHLRIGGHLSP